ncbi:MAG: hypothetical protein DLM63_02895 [Solirubrobacterales bacterium]|nr:MAG: hypothetical protein DLM63_02895 [Solirubrobacterales bacterium]
MIELFEAGTWQMTAGERATLEGILHQLKPRLAIEIGTAEGGSLSCIAAHAQEVHSLDLVAPSIDLGRFPNVTVHTGDSHERLPALLRKLEHQNRSVDFALVDGDHTAEGVQRDVEHLLDSSAYPGP